MLEECCGVGVLAVSLDGVGQGQVRRDAEIAPFGRVKLRRLADGFGYERLGFCLASGEPGVQLAQLDQPLEEEHSGISLASCFL